jgi:hypothetical protein
MCSPQLRQERVHSSCLVAWSREKMAESASREVNSSLRTDTSRAANCSHERACEHRECYNVYQFRLRCSLTGCGETGLEACFVPTVVGQTVSTADTFVSRREENRAASSTQLCKLGAYAPNQHFGWVRNTGRKKYKSYLARFGGTVCSSSPYEVEMTDGTLCVAKMKSRTTKVQLIPR